MLNIKSNLVFTLLEFQNVDIFAQGFYYFEIRVKALNGLCHRIYDNSPSYSIDEYYIYRSKEIHMKFQNQRISVHQTARFQVNESQKGKLDIIILLFKKFLNTQNQLNQQYQKVQEQIIEIRNIAFPFIQYSIVNFKFPDMSKLHISALLLPIKFDFFKTPTIKQKQTTSILKNFSKSCRFHSLTVQKTISECIPGQKLVLTLPKKFIDAQTDQMSEVQVRQQKFCKYLGLYKSLKLDMRELIQQITNNFSKNAKLLESVVPALKEQKFNFDALKQRYHKTIKSCYKSNTFTCEHHLQQKKICQRIQKIRKYFNQKSYQTPQSTVFRLLPKSLDVSSPIIIRQSEFIQKQFDHTIEFKDKIRNVCIFAHGYMGNCHDVQLIKNVMREYVGKGTYILMQSYTKIMNQDLQTICQEAFSQIKSMLILNQAKFGKLRIFMVGHSMGGVILRGCLKYLKQFQKYFHAFISLNSPHLGYFQGIKLYIEAALKVILKFKKSKSIQQLTYNKCQKLEQSYIYKLSKEGSLSSFRYLVLLSSSDDCYISWHSSRLVPYEKQKNSSRDQIEKIMLNNILKKQDSKLQRIDRIQIDFDSSQKKMDDIIGRAAHVNVLGNEKAINMLFSTCSHIFENF